MVSKSSKKEETYQEMRARLDELLLKLQDTEVDVDEAVDLYGQALELIAKLETHLETAGNRIKKVQVDFGLGGQ